MTNKIQLDLATQYAVENPSEPIRIVAARFGVIRQSIVTRLKRAGLFTPHDPRRVRLNDTNAKWKPIFAYAAEHPNEPIGSLSIRFGISAGSIGRRLTEHFGKGFHDWRVRELRCRICGVQEPAQFARSSRRPTGYQDKCKMCAHRAYLASGAKSGGKFRQRLRRGKFPRIKVSDEPDLTELKPSIFPARRKQNDSDLTEAFVGTPPEGVVP